MAKRLARGRFALASLRAQETSSVKMDVAELSLILEGIELSGATRKKRYRRNP